MTKKVCTSCEEEFFTDQTIELNGVSDKFADRVFEKLMRGDLCAECIITEEAIRETMEAN